MGELQTQLEDLVVVRQEVILQREDFKTFKKVVQVSSWTKITDSALWKRNALYFVQVVDFGPNLVKTYELNHDLFGFL